MSGFYPTAASSSLQSQAALLTEEICTGGKSFERRQPGEKESVRSNPKKKQGLISPAILNNTIME